MGSTAGSSKDESEDTCVICLSSVTERAITVPCNHYTFDFVCLVSWLQERSTCPLCKTQITAVQYDWQSPTDYKSYTILRTHVPTSTPSTANTSRASLFAPYGLPGRLRGAHRSYSPPVEDVALRRRRTVYQQKLHSLHVGSNPYSGYRDLTPHMIANSPDLQSRARAWIRRELRVFTFLYTDTEAVSSGGATTSGNAEFLLSYIVSILKMVDLRASNGHAETLLSEFLGRENATLFLHELNSWLRSPYKKVEEWDKEVQYRHNLESICSGDGV
ncbi:hypothetical protein IAQ61_010517 [Plenodomus lingam]|uniref:RING-type E3 ubiquitin transferase n=1 Tax=Leptosphaeria maculans (strain JN3 / isolate v23.1.3 / race Av1-4-5-6-7-8) TaxID=985895 RepID=E5A480_LEPMJ|nr:hypothetical protein LEMA_P098340.1 [Plenodomus lingam JN3]KAH9862314.1 hypothetical protein IAQ61_010517 [Plenodomus lingam]CBX98425.1 hypothetical protein LEMA_P098340.1 [Plenodomus lingam JN3]